MAGRSGERERVERAGKTYGEHKCTLENVPDDMPGIELKDLAKSYRWCRSLTFARTYRRGTVQYGLLEFTDPEDRDQAISELDGRMIEGCTSKLKAYAGSNYNP